MAMNETGNSMRYTSRGAKEAGEWQKAVRTRLFDALQMRDLVRRDCPIAFDASIVSSEDNGRYVLREMEINTTPGRRIRIMVTLPLEMRGTLPAVVCIHGHEGHRRIVYDADSPYKAFADFLAEREYITVSTDVGQHEVYENGRLLMGERLWDLMRCVDYLVSMPEVDSSRIGCAGLSLGGEMAMWLGAMDESVSATLSSGFLTTMDQLEQNHCLCWKFPGLRELVDFSGIYSLIAPRPLQCQNGLLEQPIHFPVSLAREALKEIEVIYADLGKPENLSFVAHEEGHVMDVPSLLAFFEEHFRHGEDKRI